MLDLWEIGVAHRDISSGNVLRQTQAGAASSVLVIDFGASLLFHPEHPTHDHPDEPPYRPATKWKHRESQVTVSASVLLGLTTLSHE